MTLGPTISRLWDEHDLARLRLAVTRGSRGAFAFAVAVAMGALWPKGRLLFWSYALIIAVSRVVINPKATVFTTTL